MWGSATADRHLGMGSPKIDHDGAASRSVRRTDGRPEPDRPAAGVWSLCWQAAVGRNFLATPELQAKVRSRLIGAHQSKGRVLVDYVLLPTEIHVVARVGQNDSVTGIARAFGNVVSRWVRQAQARRGPVLAGPFVARQLQSTDDVRQEARMLAWRAVVLKEAVSPTHYAQGALRAALGLSPSKGFDPRPLLNCFGESVPAARIALRQWLTTRPTDAEWRAWELTRGLAVATCGEGGACLSARAVRAGAAALIAAGGSYGVEGALQALDSWVGLRLQGAGAATAKGSLWFPAQDNSSQVAARRRGLVACLAVDHQLCPAAAVARHFHRAKATLCEQMASCRRRPEDRMILGTPLSRILDDLAGTPARESSMRSASADFVVPTAGSFRR